MDLDAVRTFVAAADSGQFQQAAAELAVTQQAVSKRIAALERDLCARLFTRTARGAVLTVDGQAFLPHARELLRVAERAAAAVRPGRRTLRVDVVNRRIAAAVLLQDFHRRHPDIDLDVVTLDLPVAAAVAAVEAGTLDATFHALKAPAPPALRAARVISEPHQLLVGPNHPLAAAASVTPAQLAAHPITMQGLTPGTEWAEYYTELAAAFALTIDMTGPVFGNEAFLDELATSRTLATLVGARSRYLWPDRYDLRRITIQSPSPVYPMWLIGRRDNPSTALARLGRFLTERHAPIPDPWVPSWITTAG
ncbi:LysR family transcriptional regulator [Dactylosporangium matsuzakiense]|uniref:LysR family transcriptional regulator n=1 Tax=Dactylosporangium matsuzakiense TaxID=53360 RepID=A0A9W6KXV7_9ACTN|nr:LysR family transcriptional regulator [Dactylosporangium matsuzakiense]UWZ40895.1 LysR family transcriptional regulator [Dactylosporangium matsuzakiense]GLL08571.1 LysR family transcriptional regulator [Dactylosporangium matsuzakiense]